MSIENISETEAFQKAIQGPGVFLVDFWAPWCGPCQNIMPCLDELDQKYEALNIIKVNIDENKEIPAEYGIRGVPTLLLFSNGELKDTKVGAYDIGVYSAWVEEHLGGS